jgi:tetratricopeptide (TPR) repeat protein
LALLAIAVLGLGAGGYYWRHTRPTEPPVPHLDDVDPAIVAAIEKARAAVQDSPRSGGAWGRLGMVLAVHEFLADAIVCFAEAEHLDPAQPRWPYFQGAALAQTDPGAAVAKFERVVELCDCQPAAPRLRLGEMLLGQDRLEEAKRHFDRLAESDPSNGRVQLGLARIAFRRGDLEESLRRAQLGAGDGRVRKASLLLLAELQRRRGNHSAAENAQRLATDLPRDPNWPDPFQEELTQLRTGWQAQLERADQHLRHGRLADALLVLQQVVQEHPEVDWAWYLLGKTHILRREWVAAERALRRAVELTADAAEVQFYLGAALFQQKKYQSAAACFRRAADLKPDYALAFYNLGLCRLELAETDGAREAFQTAVRCQPTLVEARTALAEMLMKTGRRAEALGHLRQALELNPQDKKAQRLLMRLLGEVVSSVPPR